MNKLIKGFFYAIYFACGSMTLCASSDTLDFSFWVGEWDVSWDEGEGEVGVGTNSITKILGGRVIHEDFAIAQGQSKGFKGNSMSVYNVQTRQWKQAWADSQGGFIEFTGGRDGAGNPMFITDVVTRNDKKTVSRMIFKDIKSDSFIWDWEQSADGGATWTLSWRINYKKKKSAEGLGNDDFLLLMGTSQCQSERTDKNGVWQDPVPMTWTFKYIMGGQGIQDEFSLADGTHGGSIRQFNSKDKEWKVHYYSSNAASPQLTSWSGKKNEQDEIVLYSPQPSPTGVDGFLKLVFHDIAEDSFKWTGAWVDQSEQVNQPFWKISCSK